MNKFLIITIVAFSTTAFVNSVSAAIPSLVNSIQTNDTEHSGRTDRNGCHRDHKNGGRHCH